jgi:hypothetical protein
VNARTIGGAAAVLVLLAYLTAIVIPVAQRNVGIFATYYTASYIFAHMPQQLAHAYDAHWFVSQFPVAGIDNFRDVFFIQPPTMAVIGLPLLVLPPAPARLVWAVASLLMLLGGLMVLARALDLSALWGVWAAPICLLYAPIRENLGLGQAYLLLFLAICVLFWGILAPRRTPRQKWLAQGMGGVALGVALIVKTALVWLWPLLLLAGHWRVLLGAAATALAIALLTLPWIGVQAWAIYAGLLPTLATDPIRYVTAYQTVTSLFGHLLVYDAQWNRAPVADWPLVAQGLTLIIQLSTLAYTAAYARLNAPDHTIRALSLAFAAALCIANAPIGEGYHYVVVLPSLLVATWYAWRAGLGWRAWAALLAAAALLGTELPYKSPLLVAGWMALLAYPRLYGAYLLWGWLGWACRREQSHRTIEPRNREPTTDYRQMTQHATDN